MTRKQGTLLPPTDMASKLFSHDTVNENLTVPAVPSAQPCQ